MSVTVRSISQILSDMVRKVLAETPLTDVSPGSVLATILEAAAISDYENSLSVLKLLESSRIESLTGSDLDSKAIEMAVPNGVGGFGRKPASRSNGIITIGSPFTKKSTSIYLAKPAPYAGSLVIYVQDALGWPATGQVYVGRGTINEEGPLSYSSITFHTSYYLIHLSSANPLIKNHKYEDQVVLAQGGIRTIPAGTKCLAPAVDDTPQVEFTTDSQVRLLDGESEVSVNVTSVTFGEDGNVAAGAVKMFSSSPFSGATVTNSLSFANGKPAETDEQLRQRIRNHYSSLSKGTQQAILGALQGLRDSVSGKTITSVNMVEPILPGEPAKCFVDDGSGLEPSFAGQTFENLLNNAFGQEVLFRTSRFPVSSCVISGSNQGPYQLTDGWTISVQIDGITEEFTIRQEDYINTSSAQPSEIVNAFNSQATSVGFRTAGGGQYVSVFDLNGDAESLQILSSDLQQLLGLPTTEARAIFLYQNNELLSFKGKSAYLQSNPFPWGTLTSVDMSGVVVKVDGVQQTFSVTDLDFQPYGSSIATATLAHWVSVLKTKVAGVHFYSSTSSEGLDILIWQTWQSQSSEGSIEIVSGGWVGNNKMWPPETSNYQNLSVGAAADFDFNRLSGQIRLINPPSPGDMITLGSELTRASVYSISADTGSYGAGVSDYGNPRLLLAFDGNTALRTLNLPLNTPVNFTRVSPTESLVEMDFGTGGSSYISEIEPGDYIYLVRNTSLGVNAVPEDLVGFYSVKYFDGNSMFIVASDDEATLFDGISAALSTDTLYAMMCDGTVPQVADLSADPILTVDSIVLNLNSQLIGGKAVKLSPRKFYIRSNNYSNSDGGVNLFASIGTAFGIILPNSSYSLQSHTASKRSSYLDGGFVKITSVIPQTLPINYYPSRGYLKYSITASSVLDSLTNPTIEAASSIVTYPVGLQEVFISGPNYGMTMRSYNNDTIAPFSGFARGTEVFKPFKQTASTVALSRYESLSIKLEDIPLTPTDTLVVEMDKDDINGIYGIPCGKSALVETMSSITGGARGSQITFTLKDPDDDTGTGFRPFFDPLSSYRDFDFNDFNVIFRSFAFHDVYEMDLFTKLPIFASKQVFMAYGTQYGQVNRIRTSIVYASSPNSDVQVFHKNYFESGAVINHVYFILPSGNVVTTYNSSYTIETQDLDVVDFNSKIVKFIIRSYDGSPINGASEYVVGDTLVIGGGNPTYSGSYLITSVSATEVHVASPGVRATSYPALPVRLEPSVNPLYTMENPGISIADLVTQANEVYFVGNPLISLRFVTLDDTVKIHFPSYYTQGSSTENTDLENISDSIDFHSISGSFGGKAHIHTYDKTAGQIIAVVQSDEPLLPTTAQMSGTTYQYVDESCWLVPSNLKSLSKWLSFTAISGLSTRSYIEVINGQKYLQISSSQKGSSGAVAVTGVTANSQEVPLLTVPSENKEGSISCSIQFAAAQALPRGTLVELTNSVPVKIGRPYRSTPSSEYGYSSITAFNTTDINTHFRDTTEVVYERVTAGVGRFTFLSSPSGYVAGDSEIEITKINPLIAKVEATGSNNLNARVGDMMVINSSVGNATYSCVSMTGDLENEYVGYPVVYIASSTEIYVIAPNATSGTTTITLSNESALKFIPHILAEKNIKTNYLPGIKYTGKEVGKDKLYYRIKTLGNNLVLAEFSYGSSSVRYDLDMLLDGMSVSSDDWIEFSDAFSPQNQGTFRIVAHNGINSVVFINDSTGGVDEIVGPSDYWGMGPIGDSDTVNLDKRHVRIWDADSVAVGNRLVITSPTGAAGAWFSNPLIGSWYIKEIGLDSDYECYIICDIPAAPSTTENVTLGSSAASLYFQETDFAETESSRVFSYKWVAGYGHSPSDEAYAELFLTPQTSLRRMLSSYGTSIRALHKIGFSEDIEEGLDAYKYYTELLAEAHKVIDGSASNPIDYPGVRALGSAIEILPPLIKSLSIDLTVLPGEGVDLNSLKLPIKSTITSYVNSSGVGQEIILSEIIKRVQQVPGVKSVVIDSTSPSDTDGVISTGSYEVARIVDQSDIGI